MVRIGYRACVQRAASHYLAPPPGQTLRKEVASVSDLPTWNFDGSSTGQAPGHDSEVLLRPHFLFRDPFRGGRNLMAFCECMRPDMTPAEPATRCHAEKVAAKASDAEAWFGFEQEYQLFHNAGLRRGTPLGWPVGGYPDPEGSYACGVGSGNAFGRQVADAHFRCCVHAGLNTRSFRAEFIPGKWAFVISALGPVAAADQLNVARFLLHRVCEDFGVVVSMSPRPVEGDWEDSHCLTRFSTKTTRGEGGMAEIERLAGELEAHHKDHTVAYGGRQQMSALYETSSLTVFSTGVADRECHIYIPQETSKNGKGYFIDQRPSSDADPYVVVSKLLETCVLGRS